MENNATTPNTKELTKPHDLLVKATLSNPQALKNFANIYLPSQVVAKMNQDSLQLFNKSYVSADMQEFYNDVVFSFTPNHSQDTHFACSSTNPYQIESSPLRFLQYQVNLINDYMKDKPADTNWPIIPICLYHNPDGKCYPYATKVCQCFTDLALAEGQ